MATTDATAEIASYYLPFFDTFENGTTSFPDAWNVDLSVIGQVTLHTPEYWLTSGMMEATGTASMGHGYGTYTVNAMLEGGYPGSAVMLWNAPNAWPLSEIDMAETIEDGSGRQYGALHWEQDDQDRFALQYYDTAIRPGVAHQYQAIWEPGRITMKVDGVTQAVFTDMVPKDFADGGWNHVFAFLNTKPETSLTVYDVRYEPLDPGAPTTPTSPGEVRVVDWDGLAAAMQANYDLTGQWYIPEGWNPDGTRSYRPSDDGAPSPDPAPAPDPAPSPDPTPDPVVSPVVDWAGLAAAVEANYLLTGQWFIPDGWNADGTRSSTPVDPAPDPTTDPVVESVVDWDGLAAAVEANYELTGQWFIPDGWNADGTRSFTASATTSGDAAAAWVV